MKNLLSALVVSLAMTGCCPDDDPGTAPAAETQSLIDEQVCADLCSQFVFATPEATSAYQDKCVDACVCGKEAERLEMSAESCSQ